MYEFLKRLVPLLDARSHKGALSERSPQEIANDLAEQAGAYLRLCEELLDDGRLTLGLRTSAAVDAWIELRKEEAKRIEVAADRLEDALAANDARMAALMAFAMAQETTFGLIAVFFDRDARRGRRTLAGGSKGAKARASTRGATLQDKIPTWLDWAEAHCDRKMSHNALSQRVARHFGVNPETVRKYLPKRKTW
jgi:hypothetical protein